MLNSVELMHSYLTPAGTVWSLCYQMDNLTRFKFFILSRASSFPGLHFNWSTVLWNTLLIRCSISDWLNALGAWLFVLVQSSVHFFFFFSLAVIGVNVIDCNLLNTLSGAELIWHLLFYSAKNKLPQIK